jgi:small subunit ribosomal protein S20
MAKRNPQAQKRARQNIKRARRNRHIRSTARTYLKRARQAIASKDQANIKNAVRKAVSSLDRAVSKGVLHHKTARRLISRLMSQANKALS